MPKSLYLYRGRYRQWFWEKRCSEEGIWRRERRCLLVPGHPEHCVFRRKTVLEEQRGNVPVCDPPCGRLTLEKAEAQIIERIRNPHH